MEVNVQSRMKSPIFWIGMAACVYQAVASSLLGSPNVALSPTAQAILSAISVGLSAVLLYCNGNNPSLDRY